MRGIVQSCDFTSDSRHVSVFAKRCRRLSRSNP